MAGNLNRAVASNGVTAYQDHVDPMMFHYMPNRIDAVLGETLREFECRYYGIGARPFYEKVDGATYDVSGGIVNARAIPDMTADQRSAITKAITERYKDVKVPNLVPLEVEKTNVQAVFANAVASKGRNASSTFPKEFKFGSSFNFNISSGSSLFAQLVASGNPGQETDVSSFIAANLTGVTKLYGDPWVARIKADLSQVWDYVRSKGTAEASLGWFNFGAGWDNVAQELKKNNVIKMEFIEGTGGDEFGKQMLEATRKVFEAINAQITSGEGLFKFDPNPTPQEPPATEKRWGSSILPYGVSINLSFAKNSFKQEIKFDEEVSFIGIREIPIMTSMNLSAFCDRNTKGMFFDVQDSLNKCIDAEVMKGWDTRLKNEIKAKNKKINEYEQMLISGKITIDQYERMIALLNVRTLSETVDADGRTVSEDEAAAAIDHEIRTFILGRG